MKKISLIDKIEGEAKLHLTFSNNKISSSFIEFFSSRDIENILLNKNALDALVINPRICGICNHSHLIATAKALESCYKDIKVSNKAKVIREVTLNFELIQNHIKWFYLVILPLIGIKNYPKSFRAFQNINKAIAIFAGQYPHNSYAIPGGITNEILPFDIIKVINLIDEVIYFFEKEMLGIDIEELLQCQNYEELLSKKGDIITFIDFILKNSYQNYGQSYDRFIVFGKNNLFESAKANKTTITKNLDIKYIKEFEVKNTFSKSVIYKDKFFEVGPLARIMVKKTPLIKDLHRRYKDSLLTRIIARVCEIPKLLISSKKLLKQIDINEKSFIKPINIKEISGSGVGIVEAARGSLIHKVKLEKGIIKDYQIITPTQWNLGNGISNLGVAEKALLNTPNDKTLIELIFKSFDVCSVCTTH